MAFLEYRHASDLHRQPISATMPPKDDTEFLRLVKEIFEHQRAAYGRASSSAARARRAKDFYSFYEPPSLARSTDPVHGVTISPEEAFKTFFSSPEAPNRNNVFYLTGDVGVGKSSFVNWMISHHAEVAVARGDCWFIRLDLERIKGIEPLSYDMFVEALAEKVSRVLHQFPETLHGSLKAVEALEQFTRALHSGDLRRVEGALFLLKVHPGIPGNAARIFRKK